MRWLIAGRIGLAVGLLARPARCSSAVAAGSRGLRDGTSRVGAATAADPAAERPMRGTTRHTRQQIKDELDRLKARVGVSGRATQATLTIETIRENLPAVLKLAAEILREPAFPQKEFDELKQENLAANGQPKSEPGALGSTADQRPRHAHPNGDRRTRRRPRHRGDPGQGRLHGPV